MRSNAASHKRRVSVRMPFNSTVTDAGERYDENEGKKRGVRRQRLPQ
jgi:hypothetical protein